MNIRDLYRQKRPVFSFHEIFYRFLERMRAAGVTRPVAAGVMPILRRNQIQRIIFLGGASLPADIIKGLHKYEHRPADLRTAGIGYAVAQTRELAQHGADSLHIDTINHPEIAKACASAWGRI